MNVGDCATVSGYAGGAHPYRQKLLAMGLTRGTPLTVQRMAPMGDPVEIEIRGFMLIVNILDAANLERNLYLTVQSYLPFKTNERSPGVVTYQTVPDLP